MRYGDSKQTMMLILFWHVAEYKNYSILFCQRKGLSYYSFGIFLLLWRGREIVPWILLQLEQFSSFVRPRVKFWKKLITIWNYKLKHDVLSFICFVFKLCVWIVETKTVFYICENYRVRWGFLIILCNYKFIDGGSIYGSQIATALWIFGQASYTVFLALRSPGF